MKIEDKLSEMMNGAEVPDELLPQNIAVMLKAKSAASKMESEHKNIASASNVSAKRRTIIMKTSAAAAACAVFAAGMFIYRSDMDEQKPLDAQITYEATSPESYDEFYKIYTGITLNGIDAPDSERTVEDDVNGSSAADDASAYDFSDAGISGADIVKRDGNYLYCLKDRTIHIISLETMKEVSAIECPLEPPFEFYIEDGEVILISKEKQNAAQDENDAASSGESAAPDESADTAINSDGSGITVPADKTGCGESGKSAIPADVSVAAVRTNAAVSVYDVSDPSTPVRTASFKQNGRYVLSKLTGGVLYTVTAYSNYRVKPLDTKADLDSFVPAYYIDGGSEKTYLAANDIIVLPNASSTAYTVISAIDIKSGLKEVKAVLGADKYIYCSDDTLYIACTGKKDKEYSAVYSFSLSDGHIAYRSSGSVEGTITDRRSMDEYKGKFRIAAEINEDGEKSVAVYVLDKSLTVVNSAGKLPAGQEVSAVRFEKDRARVFSGENGAVTVLDLSSTPPVIAGSMNEKCIYEYSDDMLIGVGKAQDGLSLTMYADTGLALNGTVITGKDELLSPALSDRRSVLTDSENGIIGIPAYSYNEFGTRNSYFVYTYDDAGGFMQKGVIEYMDVDDDMQFKRAYIDGETLYIVSSGRIISVRLSDMKVISVYAVK